MRLTYFRLTRLLAFLLGVAGAGLSGPVAAAEFELRVTSAVSEAGGEVDVYLLSTHARDLYAFQAAIALPKGLELLAVDAEGCPAVRHVEIHRSQHEASGEAPCLALGAVLVSGSEDRQILAGADVRLAHLRLRVSEDVAAGTILPLGFQEPCGKVRTRVTARLEPSGAEDVVPALAAGEVRVEPGVRRPSAVPHFTCRAKVCAYEDRSLALSGDWPSGLFCEVEVRREGASCPDVVLRLEQPVIPGSAFPEIGAYSIRFRWGNGAGFGDWSEPQRLEITQCAPFLRSDANGDGGVNIVDAVFTLIYLFRGERVPPCLAAADSNRDDLVNLSDALHTLNFLFRAGPAPPGPYPACGYPAAPALEYEKLGCESPGSCR